MMIRKIPWVTAATLSFCCILVCCKESGKYEPQEEVDVWVKNSVMELVGGKMWRVQNVYVVIGKDTFDLAKAYFDNVFFKSRHEVIFGFYPDYLPFWSTSKPLPDSEGKFNKPAEIHYFSEKSEKPSQLYYSWNEPHNTLEIASRDPGHLQIPQGYTAYLVKSAIVNYPSYQEEEKASQPSSLMFKIDTNTGTYLFEMRRVWWFESDLDSNNYARYVVFP